MSKSSNQQSKSNHRILLGGVIGFVLGISGNLISGWIQDELFKNVFSTNRLAVIFFVSITGIAVAYFLDKSSQSENKSTKSTRTIIDLSTIKLWWSKFKVKGKRIAINDIFSVGSEIDINSEEQDNKE